ncbi:MAG: DUF3365 domain-containing protein [Gammaproteobacteria bacterium]|nr:DUF3365 domain-containing protein [Gammaproteobacteria bacterium]
MKKIILALMVTTLPVACATIEKTPQLTDSEKQALVAEGKKIFMEFANNLVGHVKGGLKSGGPVKTIEICNRVAPAVAAELSIKHGVELARTSLKLRNPDNAPDAWEKNVLIKFEERKAAGEDIQKLAYNEIIIEDGKAYFRMMKAIPTAEKPCLMCHGEKARQDIDSKLSELYPEDKARGYKTGDIRGAFTLKKAL